MAVAEAEPKETEVGVKSTLPSHHAQGFTGPQNTKSTTSSTKTFKSYSLYKNIKDFRFFMPSGWNDKDLGIFIDVCKENIRHLSKSDENIKWEEIALSGAERSVNKTLFTINCCMEVAQCIKSYIKRTKQQSIQNEVLKAFIDSVSDLLPFFPEPNTNRCRGFLSMEKLYSTKLQKYFKTDSICKTVKELIKKYYDGIVVDDDLTWAAFSKDVSDLIGVQTDIKSILCTYKRSFLNEIELASDPEVKKQLLLRNVDYKEIFDYLDLDKIVIKNPAMKNSIPKPKPSEVRLTKSQRGRRRKKSADTGESSSCPSVENNPNPDNSTESEPTNVLNVRDEESTGKMYERENVDAKNILGEPSSTTSDGALSPDPSMSPPSEDNTDNLADNKESDSDDELSGLLNNMTRGKHREMRPRQRPIPSRILPSREAKNKVISPSSNRTPPLMKSGSPDISNNFRGFDEPIDQKLTRSKFVHKYTVKRVITKTTYTNPDTTTNDNDDDSDSGISNSCGASNTCDVPSEKSSPGHSNLQQDNVEFRYHSVVHPDSTHSNMQPVVKLRMLDELEFKKKLPLKRKREADEINSFGECSSSPGPSPKQNTPVESAVLGKDVIDKVYNPSADSAKILDGPLTPSEARKVLGKHPNRKNDLLQNNFNDTDSSDNLRGRETFSARGKLLHSKVRAAENCMSSTSSNNIKGHNIVRVKEGMADFTQSGGSSSYSCGTEAFPSTSKISKIVKSDSTVAVRENRFNDIEDETAIKIYQQKPSWFDDFVGMMKHQQAWKMHKFEEMHKKIMICENKKVLLLEKLINKIDTT